MSMVCSQCNTSICDRLFAMEVAELLMHSASTVRSMDWIFGGLLVTTTASASYFSFEESGTARRKWAIGNEKADLPACEADAGAAGSTHARSVPALFFLSLPLAGELTALIANSELAVAWTASLSSLGSCVSAPALAFGRLFTHSADGTIGALRQRDGQVQWVWARDASAQAEAGGSEPVLTAAPGIVVSVVQSRSSDDNSSGSSGGGPEPIANCTALRLVRALSAVADEPRVLWESTFGAAGKALSPPIGSEAAHAARAAAGVAGSECACSPALRPPRLERVWVGAGQGRSASSTGGSEAAGRSEHVIVASVDPCSPPSSPAASFSNGTVAALDELSGWVRWSRALPAGVRCSRAAADFGGRLFMVCSAQPAVGVEDGGGGGQAPELLALDGADGSVLWTLDLSTATASAEPAPGGGGGGGVLAARGGDADDLCAGGSLGLECELVVSTASQPALSADGTVHVLGALRPRLGTAAGLPARCLLMRVATRPALLSDADGEKDGAAAEAARRVPRALGAVPLVGGRCDAGWLGAHGGSRPLVLLHTQAGPTAVAAGTSAWLVSRGDACTGVTCEHGVCRNGSCYCEADYLGSDCSQPYSPYRAEWPVWIGLGATVSLLCVFFFCLVGVYRSFLWVKFRMQMLQVRHEMESRGYTLPNDDSTISGDVRSGQITPRRAAPLLAGASDGGQGGSTVSLLDDAGR